LTSSTAIAVGGGLGLDPAADGVAAVDLVGGILLAGGVWVYEVFQTSGNKNYPGPWTYTYLHPSQNPINFTPTGLHNGNDNYPDGWNNKVLRLFITGVITYDAYNQWVEHMDQVKRDATNFTPKDVQTFKPSNR
jgi:hypothetical protein